MKAVVSQVPSRATAMVRPLDVAAAATLAALTVGVVTGAGGSDTSVAAADLSAVAAALAAAAAVARRIRTDASTAQPWRWLLVALLLWAGGEILWTWYEVVRGVDVPFPSAADVSYLAAVPFAALGLLGFVRASGARFRMRVVLDGCIIAASLLFIGWALALGPSFRAGGDDLVSHMVSIAYPLTDVVLAALALFVLQWGGARERRALAIVAAGLLTMAVADTIFTWLTNYGTYTSSNPISMMWPASYLVLGYAARTSRLAPSASSDDDRLQTTVSLLLPYGSMLAAGSVALFRIANGQALGPFLTIDGLVVVTLVLVRQAVTAWELRDVVLRLHERETELARLALEDPLTGLANRARFNEELDIALSDATLHPAVLYIDLDGFKSINDRFGHAVGDRVLTVAAERLRAVCGSGTLVARLGGDEFVVLVAAGEARGAEIAHRVMEEFAVPFFHDGELITLCASVGLAAAPQDGSPDEVVRRADAAMYVAKTTGKGRVVQYPDDLLVRGGAGG